MIPIELTGRRQAAAALKALRYQAGYSVAELAHRLGVCSSTICYREKGERAFHIDTLTETAAELGYRLVLQPTAALNAIDGRPTGTGWPA